MILKCRLLLFVALIIWGCGDADNSPENGAQLASAAAPVDKNAPPYIIEWPAGWDITHPPPMGAEGIQVERIRATRWNDEEPAAVIELVYIPLGPSTSLKLDDEFDAMLSTLIEPYRAGGMTTKVEEMAGSLAGLPARQAQLTSSGSGVVVSQWVAMAISDRGMYSLFFAGPESEFNRYWGEFQKLLGSLELH